LHLRLEGPADQLPPAGPLAVFGKPSRGLRGILAYVSEQTSRIPLRKRNHRPSRPIRCRPATALVLLASCLAQPLLLAQAHPAVPEKDQQTYQRILAAVEAIPIFDNHSHPGFADDSDVDAMTIPPSHGPLRLRLDNPELIAASKALFDYPYTDNTPEHLKWLTARKAQLRREATGYQYFDRILDKLNVETMMANRVAMPNYLDPHRFGWVFFVDSLLFPFNNSDLAARNPDIAVNIPLQEKKLKTELQQEGLTGLPKDLPGYLAFATKLLEQNKARGGRSIKFEIAYFRPLRFADPPASTAASIYARYHAGGVPTPAERTAFEDFLFRYLLTEAGRLHLPVQIHTAVGAGDYYNVAHGNILNLENVLRDPRYNNVTFVLLHGGYPFQQQAIWLTARENVYLDSSLMGVYLYPEDLKQVLRQWLLLYPDKVVFGSDAFPFNEAIGAEESDWLAITTARSALAAALTSMIGNGEVTEQQAMHFAHAFLHDTAAKLYQDSGPR
jgi:hypothetical protein